MYKQLNLTDLVKSVKTQIENNTELKCFDVVPENEQSPLVFVEVVGIENSDTKTMYCKTYTLWLHVIAEALASSVPLYKYIADVQEAMSTDINIPEPFDLITQTDNGIQTIKTDESGEKHAVLEFSFRICYGYMIK